MDSDTVNELRQERSGEGVDVTVALEVLDEVVRFVLSFGSGEGCFEVGDTRLQASLFLFVLLFVDAVLVSVDESALEVGVEVGKEIFDFIQFLFLRLDLFFNIDGAFRGGLVPPHFFYHLVGVNGDIHHPLDAVQHAVVQPLIADRVRRARGAALAVGGTLVVDVGLVGIVVDLFDQRVTAVGALQQSREEVDAAAFCRAFHTRLQHLLYAVEVVFVNNGLMRPFDDDPFVGCAVADRFGLVIDLLAFALHHRAGVHQVRERAADRLVTPQRGAADRARFEIQSFAALVSGGIENAVFVEMPHDTADAGAVQIHFEDQPDILGGFLVNHQLVVIGGVFFVAVFCEGTDEITAAALHIEGGADALGVGGDVVFVDHPSHTVVEEVDGDPLAPAGVNRVVDRDVANPQTGEHLADVAAAFRRVAPEA